MNTQFYRIVFGCQPDDTIDDVKQIEKIITNSDVRLYNDLVSTVRGLAVDYPLGYMYKEDLRKKGGLANIGLYLVPESVFT